MGGAKGGEGRLPSVDGEGTCEGFRMGSFGRVKPCIPAWSWSLGQSVLALWTGGSLGRWGSGMLWARRSVALG